jgi:hypothetical protein
MRSGPPVSTVVSRLHAITEPLCANAFGLLQGVTRQIEVSVGLAESVKVEGPFLLATIATTTGLLLRRRSGLTLLRR